MNRRDAAFQLGQLLQLDAVGCWLDVLGDERVRDLVLKASFRLREIRDDIVAAESMETL